MTLIRNFIKKKGAISTSCQFMLIVALGTIFITSGNIKVPESFCRNRESLDSRLKTQFHNIPRQYWLHEFKYGRESFNRTCAKYPALAEIHYNNLYWQQFDTSSATYYLLAAFLDDRFSEINGSSVRILASRRGKNKGVMEDEIYCQLWFNHSTIPLFSKVYFWKTKWGSKTNADVAIYLSCQLPMEHKEEVPESVSLVETPCQSARTNLRVVYNKIPDSEREDIGVCIKTLNYPDDNGQDIKLVEWMEMMRVLGAKKVFFYIHFIHPKIEEVLKYYSDEGLVEILPLPRPGKQPNIPHTAINNRTITVQEVMNEFLPYGDCFYRQMYRYKYLACMDIDELLVPKLHDNLPDLMEEVSRNYSVKNPEKKVNAFCFRNINFADNMLKLGNNGYFPHIPKHLHMMQHVFRSINFTGAAFKCLYTTQRVLIPNIHGPVKCYPNCLISHVLLDFGAKYHYRYKCKTKDPGLCVDGDIMQETTVWRWKDLIEPQVDRVLSSIGLDGI